MKEIFNVNNEEQLEYIQSRSEEILDLRKQGKKVQYLNKTMKDVVKEKNLILLSAPWIGYTDRVFVINFSGTVKCFVNPVITNCEQFCMSRETTPIIPGKEYLVPRYAKINMTYQDVQGKVISAEFVGAGACYIQQAVDSLEGVTLDQFALELPEGFDDATEEEKDELVKYYLDSIDTKVTELNAEIDSDPEAKQMKDAVDFMVSVKEGKTKLDGVVDVNGNKVETVE